MRPLQLGCPLSTASFLYCFLSLLQTEFRNSYLSHLMQNLDVGILDAEVYNNFEEVCVYMSDLDPQISCL